MSGCSELSGSKNQVIYIKKDVEHLLSNPVFYNHGPPQIERAAVKISHGNGKVDVACSDCINSDLRQKKIAVQEHSKEEDKVLLDTNKQKIAQKHDKEVRRSHDKKLWYIQDLGQQAKLFEGQKVKEKHKKNEQDVKLLEIMKTAVLKDQRREKMEKRERTQSQMELKHGLDVQLVEKQNKQNRQREEKLNFVENPKCLPSQLQGQQSKSRSTKHKYKLDLDEMVRQKQRSKGNESQQILQRERARLLKVMERERQEQIRLQRNLQDKKKAEIGTMQQNAILKSRRKQSVELRQKQNLQTYKTFFDEDKRKVKEQQKKDTWKQELKTAMRDQGRPISNYSNKQETRSSRVFSNYRVNNDRGVSGSKDTKQGVKIVVKDDKVCCNKCHLEKPSRDIGNYIFG